MNPNYLMIGMIINFHWENNTMIKHNKLRNTGLIFEILTRISMHEVLNGKPQNAIKVIKKHFNSNSNLLREFRLYESLTKQEKGNLSEEFLNLTLSSRKKIDSKKLQEEKYDLVKTIKTRYKIDEFFGTRVSNYKLLASIYKIFENKGDEFPEDYIDSKTLVLEHITGKKEVKTTSEADEIISEASDPDVVKLGLKIIIERFNDKYKNLNRKQRTLLSKFINEDNNSDNFKEYIYSEVSTLSKQLAEISKNVDDKITEIKIKESITLLQEIVSSPLIKDEHLSAMLKFYELVEVLKK